MTIKMDSIRIDTGEKRLLINDDENRVLVFNPTDVLFAERFYSVLGEFETKLKEYQTRTEAIESIEELDKNGLPANAAERIGILKETAEYVRGQIDYLFGEGTSQMVFGDALNLNMFTQFFEGITPHIQNARASQVEKYTVKRGAK